MNNSNNTIAISLISTFGGIVIAYITYVASQRVQTKRAKRQPKDRMEQMFDGYERLIKAKDIEDERKTRTITNLENMVSALEDEVAAAKTLVNTTRSELETSKVENTELRQSLKELRATYDTIKRQNKQSDTQ